MKQVDVLVIGAGIQGAGVAQAAAARGCSVLVVEKCAVAGNETSRASSKLLHGGLRYLETGQFRLVYECLRERKLLLRNAPELASLAPFYIPVYQNSRRHPFVIGIGLILYWALSGFDSNNRFRLVGKSDWSKLPCSKEKLRAVFQYYDAQTDDQALTQAVLRSAQKLGAEVVFNTECSAAEYMGDAYRVRLSDGQTVTCSALVNAGGPWVNEVAQRIEGAPTQALEWMQGTHIVLAKPAPMGCFYLEAPQDGRAVFVLPWKGKVMVGTTEKPLSQPRAEPTQEEIDYLLGVYNHYFRADLANGGDICEVMCGTRVLPLEDCNASKRSRETLFQVDTQGKRIYLGIYGGKLTSYRATAAKVMEFLTPALAGRLSQNTSTEQISLS